MFQVLFDIRNDVRQAIRLLEEDENGSEEEEED